MLSSAPWTMVQAPKILWLSLMRPWRIWGAGKEKQRKGAEEGDI